MGNTLFPYTSQKHCVYTVTTEHFDNSRLFVSVDAETSFSGRGFRSAFHYGSTQSSSHSTNGSTVGSQEEALEFVKNVLPETCHAALPAVWSDRFTITHDNDGRPSLL